MRHFCVPDIAGRVCTSLSCFSSKNVSQIANMKCLLLFNFVAGTFDFYEIAGHSKESVHVLLG
jgi:hypothetical protein